MSALHPVFQQVVNNFAPLLAKPVEPAKPVTGRWSHCAVVGEGNVPVHCTFDVDEDGDLTNLQVHDGVINATKYLSFHQIEELECECWDSYEVQAKQWNDEMAISRKYGV